MRILYVAPMYDYGKPEQGYSFEHYNFFDCLVKMGHEILYFDYLSLHQQHGQEKMNEQLLKVVQAEKPELMFTVLFQNELLPETIRTISEGGQTLTFNWFTDDHWRFDNFSRKWAANFNWVSTTANSALQKYADIGYANVIKTQWACNHFLYQRLKDALMQYDVTFVGQPYGQRRQIIEAIREAHFSINVWGKGWGNGRISQADMIHVFNQSKINLNLSNASTSSNSSQIIGTKRFIAKALNSNRISRYLKEQTKTLLFRSTLKSSTISRTDDQIKGRNFEVPGCGAFVLTGYADNIKDYYVLDREVVCFFTLEELIEKLSYYLSHDDERQKIADAGYRRTLHEHTYVHRFSEIFQRMGFNERPAEVILSQPNPQVGQVITIQ